MCSAADIKSGNTPGAKTATTSTLDIARRHSEENFTSISVIMAASVCLEHSPSCTLCWPTTASKGDKAVMQGTIRTRRTIPSCEADSGANVLMTRFPARSKIHIEDFRALNSFIHRLC